MPLISRGKQNHDPQSRIWISDTDGEGCPVNPRFKEIAYLKEKDFFRFKSKELNDPALTASLIEEAVYSASRATRDAVVEDVAGYLFRTYANLVSLQLLKGPRITNVEQDLLYSLAGSTGDAEIQLGQSIYRSQVLEAMDDDARWAWERRLLGFKVQTIARELKVSDDCLSTRLRRGLKEALGRLLANPA